MRQFISAHRYSFLLGIGIFLFAFLFFAHIHPVYPYDLDDWKIMLRVREAYPSIYEWNPTRILPEILMPRCGEFAMVVLYPLVGDITLSICIVTALLLSLLISLYMLFFYRYIRRTTNLSGAASVMLTLSFFAFHFLIFRTFERENQHLFYSYDLTDHFFYTVPNIIGSILVLIFMTNKVEFFDLKSSLIKKSLFLLAIYLLVFSNLFDSIILSAFVGSFVLFRVIQEIRGKKKWSDIFNRYWLHICVVILWLVAIGFEPFGGNAKEINSQTQTFSEALVSSTKNMIQVLFFQTNKVATTTILIVIILFLAISFRKKDAYKEREPLYILLFSGTICAIFLTLLGAATFPYYLFRVMTIYAVPFFFILAGFYSAAKLFRSFPKAVVILPFAMLFVICNIERRGKTFQDVQTFLIPNDQQCCYQVSPSEILERNRQNIQTLITSNRAGRDTLTLFVPRYEQDGNWPISWSYGRSLSRFLLRYHLVSRKMEVSIDCDSHNNDFTK